MSSLGPILPGRMPSSLSTTRLLARLRLANSEISRLQDQAATGQRFFLPGQDPTAAIKAIQLQSTIERRTTMRTNVEAARSTLQLTESSLASIGDGLNRARSLVIAGAGNTVTGPERAAIADEFQAVIDGILSASNTKSGNRYLFGGSYGTTQPFERLASGNVRYKGDDLDLETIVNVDFQLALNVDGADAFSAFNEIASGDLNAGLTLDTKLAALNEGRGVQLGSIQIATNDGVNPVQTETIDLSDAKTVRDLKTVIENAFAGGPPTVTVDVDPGSNNGIRIRQSGAPAGAVTVTDLAGSQVAANLGIAGTGTEINGGDLDPVLTLTTTLASLNGGTGIGATAGNGLRITSGSTTKVVDVDGAVTIEDLFNRIEATGLDLATGFTADGTGIEVRGRRSGESLTIGENNGANATNLGLRTFTGSTQLADLNLGVGVPNQATDSSGSLLPAEIVIQRRDGTTTSTIDLAGLTTVQQVLDAITAVDADLTATLNTVGNGITITDASGVGPLVVEAGPVADALGIAGTQTPVAPLVGSDVNPQTSRGLYDVLLRAEAALRSGDNAELLRLEDEIDDAIGRFSVVRADAGNRLRTLENVENQLLDEDTALQTSLSKVLDADIAEVVTRVAAIQASLQATLQIAGSSQSLSILNFL